VACPEKLTLPLGNWLANLVVAVARILRLEVGGAFPGSSTVFDPLKYIVAGEIGAAFPLSPNR